MCGPPGSTREKQLKGVATADDLVYRKFHRLAPNELWVTDITEHLTREGTEFCAEVLDGCSRKIGAWAIDSKPDSTLVISAFEMALRTGTPAHNGFVHVEHGVQLTICAHTQKIRTAGLLPSLGTVDDALDYALTESFWSSLQIELLNRKKWMTRIELANAMFEYIEVFCTRRRRHSSVGHPIRSTRPSAD